MNYDSLGACQGDPRLPTLRWNWFLPLLFPWGMSLLEESIGTFLFLNATLRGELY